MKSFDFFSECRYFDQPALCLKCVLDGIPSNEKLTDIQKKMISDILSKDKFIDEFEFSEKGEIYF